MATNTPSTTKRPRCVSLFAGGGGMTLGFQHAGFKTVMASDVEASAARTFAHNFPHAPFLHADIRHLTKNELVEAVGGEVDVVVGGPPCQGFSTIGDQNPADPRNGLFWCFARVVEWLRPACFVMENVNYLRTQYGGRYEREIVRAFQRLGYHVHVTTLNAADYGVPQIGRESSSLAPVSPRNSRGLRPLTGSAVCHMPQLAKRSRGSTAPSPTMRC